MQNSFFQAICRMGIFMICAQAILHFRPQEAYEKYLKLLVSVMVLIQLFMPLGSFLLGGGGQEAADLLEQFKQELEQGMETARESAEEADEMLQQMTLEEVRRRMEEQENAGEGEKGEMEEEKSGVLEKQGGSAAEEKEEKEEKTGDWKEKQDNLGEDGESSQDSNGVCDGEADRIQVDVEPVEPVTVGGGD